MQTLQCQRYTSKTRIQIEIGVPAILVTKVTFVVKVWRIIMRHQRSKLHTSPTSTRSDRQMRSNTSIRTGSLRDIFLYVDSLIPAR